jgi:hypothetical protein
LFVTTNSGVRGTMIMMMCDGHSELIQGYSEEVRWYSQGKIKMDWF